MSFDKGHLSLMALMKNCNRRTFLQVFLSSVTAFALLPRKAVGRGLDGAADANDIGAAAALIKKPEHAAVPYTPRARRSSSAEAS